MKIGFDAKRLFNNFTGLGNYSRSVINGLSTFYPENQYYLFTPKISERQETKSFLDTNAYTVVQPYGLSKKYWRNYGCVKDIKKNNLNIYHGLSHELPIGIKKTGVKSVVTIHDLIYKTFPHDFTFIDRNIYDLKFRYACENADKIIAVSNSSKNDIIRYFNIPQEKIEVIYQTCNSIFKTFYENKQIEEILKKHNLPDEYMLYVGSVTERKNLMGILKALNSLKKQIDIPLVVVGKGRKYLKKAKEYILKQNMQKHVIFTSNIPTSDLPAIYQKARLFIYPSKYEGFGIPIIEAHWSKTPVITSNNSSLPEAAGPSAFYCDPYDEGSIAEGIIKILSDESYAKQLAEGGYKYVQRFEEKTITKQLMEVYNSLIK